MNVLRANLAGQILTSRAAARIMVQRGGGRIVNLTSARLAAYSASKAATNNLTNVLHQEFSHLGVRTVAVAPGLTDTLGMRRSIGADHIARVASTYPRGRLVQPEDLAALFAFLASDDADPMPGTVISVRP